MIANVIVDTSILLKAFSVPDDQSNVHREFLDLFLKWNKPREQILYLCIDYPPSAIYGEYSRAIDALDNQQAKRDFDEWYKKIRRRGAIVAEDGNVGDIPHDHHQELRRYACNPSELTFIARAFHNHVESRIIVVDECDLEDFRKSMLRRGVSDYLQDEMEINIIVNVHEGIKWVEHTIKTNVNVSPSTEAKELITAYFDLQELQDLCHQLNIPFDELNSTTHSGKARELVKFCERHNQIAELIHECRELRPFCMWPDAWKYP